MATIKSSISIGAPHATVLRFASDPGLLAEWNNEYISCGPARGPSGTGVLTFRCAARWGGDALWKLTLTERTNKGVTRVDAKVYEKTSVRDPRRWLQIPGKSGRKARLTETLHRLKGFAEADALPDSLKPPDMVALLGVYASQFGSYTTLLWQVPALGLTAQAFLMTIILGTGGTPASPAARYTACTISIIVAFASAWLMHNQRARAINHAELAKRISYKLSLSDLLGGGFSLDDAIPNKGADTQNVWATNRYIYAAWRWCMYLFVFADIVVIISLKLNTTWFT
jgi:Polyketide cyclase / dehydrase and lipid transport